MDKIKVVESFMTSAWDGTYGASCSADCTFTHGGQVMPVDAFFGWCTAVGMAKAFPDWKWTNAFIEVLPDGRVRIGSQQTTGVLKGDIPAVGPFPEIKLDEVPKDSPLLSGAGAVLDVEIGYYSFDADGKVCSIEYTGELQTNPDANTAGYMPTVGPPLLYAMAGKPLPPPPAQ